MHDIPEADWKVFRRVHAVTLARFCEQVLAEAERLAKEGGRSPHERYRELYTLIKERDKKMGRLFDNPRRSAAVHMLAQLRGEGLLPEEEFSTLTPGTRAAVELVQDGLFG